jgi:regulator of sigma E protease
MEQVLNWIYVGVAVLGLFGASIFVHEYGHFWMARRRGLKIDGFSIGFGPKLFSWKDRQGVEWALRWIPAGGFVKLPQMITSEAIEGKAEEHGPGASPLSRILVAVAGPLMNIGFAFLIAALVWQVGLPVPVNPSIIGYVEPDSAEAKLGIKPGDRIISVGGRLVHSWQEVQQFTALALTNVLPVEIDRAGVRSTYSLKAEPVPGFGLKVLNLDPRDHPVVSQVVPGGAAEAAGLQKDDQFVNFAGVPVVGQAQLVELIKQRAGVASAAELLRGTNRLTLFVTPKLDPTAKVGRIGVELSPSKTIIYTLQRPGPTPWVQVKGVVLTMRDIFVALLHPKETGVRPKDMSGPAGILSKLAVDVNTDLRLALGFMVMLNINLALLNLLPLPVLDGGHITMALYELIARRRVSPRFQEYATMTFAVMLLSFMLYVTFFDLSRASLFLRMFRQKSVIEEPGVPPTPVGN